jgi:hypothetical protein
VARFFVNRGGGRAPEGPFEEAQIVRLIRANKLDSGHISPVGALRFVPLASHPPFARALAEMGVTVEPEAAERRTALPQPKNNRGLLLGAVLCIFGLALAAVAIGSYVMFNNGGMPPQSAVPTDTEVLLEVPNLRQTLGRLHDVRVLDANELVGKQLIEDAANDLSASFDVPKPRIDSMLLAASSLGVAARGLASAPEGGLLLSFSSATPVNAFLASKRFKYTGLAGKTGRKYALGANSAEIPANANTVRRSLWAFSLDPKELALVWFETAKILFVGSPAFADKMASVIALDVPALEQTPEFHAVQKDFAAGADVVGFVNPTKLVARSDLPSKAFLGWSQQTGPLALSARLGSAGLLTRFVAHERDEPGQAPTSTSSALAVIDRLPAETFAYVAVATQSELSGAELERTLLARLTSVNPEVATQTRAEIVQLEARFGTHLDAILGSIGDQAALAALAPSNYELSLGAPQKMLEGFALLYAQALKDEAPARALVARLKSDFSASLTEFQIQEDAHGYSLAPKDLAYALRAEVRFEGGYLFVALGGNEVVTRAERAFFAHENTLANEPAHRAARTALPNEADVILWLDAGRVLETARKNPIVGLQIGASHFGSAVHLSGPDRVTAALALSHSRAAGGTTYRIDALNLPVFADFVGFGLP